MHLVVSQSFAALHCFSDYDNDYDYDNDNGNDNDCIVLRRPPPGLRLGRGALSAPGSLTERVAGGTRT